MTARLSLTALALWIVLPAAAFAADGRIAFTSSRDGNSELYSVSSDGSALRRLTFTPGVEQSPDWSPDGERIAYESDAVDGRMRIHVMNADGSGQALVSPPAPDSVDEMDPAWSPDGQRIAFASTRGGTWQIWVVNVDGSGLERVTDGFATDPSWSPDGQRIAYASFDGIWVVNADGTDSHELTEPSAAWEGNPSWSPNGTEIAFYRNTLEGRPGELFAVRADGSGERQVTTGGYWNARPSWSPDGTEIVFQREAGGWRLMAVGSDGTGLREVTSGADDLTPDWGTSTVVPEPPPPDAPTIEIFSPEDGAVFPQGVEVVAFYLCSSATSFVVSCEGDVPLGGWLDTARPGTKTFTVTAEDIEGRRSTKSVTYAVLDFTPPQVDVLAPRDGGEYRQGDRVLVDYSCTDDATVLVCDGTLPPGAPLDTSEPGTFTFQVFAVDDSHNVTEVTVTYRVIDDAPPSIVVASPADGAVYTLGEQVRAQYECSDDSVLAWCRGTVLSGELLDTSSVGAKTFTVTATDHARNLTTVTRSYVVVYEFEGFFAPLHAGVNESAAGETVPVKFSLHGDQGLDVFADGSPSWRPCGAQDASPASGRLSYHPSADRYQYLWETDAAWAGGCRELVLRLRDGTARTVVVTFG